MSGVVAALLTALVALFFTQLFYSLPEATLGAIVIVAVSHMVKLQAKCVTCTTCVGWTSLWLSSHSRLC